MYPILIIKDYPYNGGFSILKKGTIFFQKESERSIGYNLYYKLYGVDKNYLFVNVHRSYTKLFTSMEEAERYKKLMFLE